MSDNIGVVIGRFEPPHIGHFELFQKALDQSDKLIILVGSSFEPRTVKNPFTFEERKRMILDFYPVDIQNKIIIEPLRDYPYRDGMWMHQIQEKIKLYADIKDVTIFGHSKDNSSYYLKYFDNVVDVGLGVNVHATDIRNMWFESQQPFVSTYENYLIPLSVYEFMCRFKHITETFPQLQQEYFQYKAYKEQFKDLPFPPIFITVDTFVKWKDKVLLITRGKLGIGKLALPGGFLDSHEYIKCAALRELKEETNIDVLVVDLRQRVIIERVFDHPLRSLRGRIITHCFMIDLSHLKEPPFVEAADDAKQANWVDIEGLKSEDFFDDHFHMIEEMMIEFDKYKDNLFNMSYPK